MHLGRLNICVNLQLSLNEIVQVQSNVLDRWHMYTYHQFSFCFLSPLYVRGVIELKDECEFGLTLAQWCPSLHLQWFTWVALTTNDSVYWWHKILNGPKFWITELSLAVLNKYVVLDIWWHDDYLSCSQPCFLRGPNTNLHFATTQIFHCLQQLHWKPKGLQFLVLVEPWP